MILGIDLGTEWCRLTTADEQGQLQMISSAQRQDQKTPVAVCYVGEWLWGWSALDAAEPAASDLKRCFGRRDVGSAAAAADGQSLLEEFLRGLRLSLLEMFGRHRENHIVLTVPYWFGIRERQVVRQSLANAGLHVDAIINDAEAALIACHVENHIERGEKAKVLVVDAGAESTVLSLLEVGWQDDCLWPELISYDDETPGFRSVHRAVLEEIGFQGDAALSHASITLALGPLLNQESDFTIDLQGREWQVRQEQVKTAVNAWNAAVKAGLRRLWQTSHVSAGEVQIALATGGGCEIERARQTIATFPIVLEPPANARPESLAAWGAGRYALMLSGRIPRRFRGPQMPAVGLAIADGDFHPILEVDHGDGCPDFRVYAPQNDGDGTITVLPMQGLARRAAANRPLLSEPWQLPQAIGPQDLLVSVIRQVVRDEDGSDRHHLRFQMHHGRDRHEKTVEIGWLEDHSDNTSANRPANDGVT